MSILINAETRVICQGFTGSQGTFHSEQAIAYGTKMVGGVTPGKGGQTHLGLTGIQPSLRQLRKQHGNASVIYVPRSVLQDSILEAAYAGIELSASLKACQRWICWMPRSSVTSWVCG